MFNERVFFYSGHAYLGKQSKKINSGYNEFGTKGGRVSDLNHYFKQLSNSEKGQGGLR